MTLTFVESISLIWVVAIILAVIGWILNFNNLFQYEAAQTEFIASAIGIFVLPLGALTGWFY